MSQLPLLDAPTIPEHRVRALAGVLAGFAWPERGTFEALTKKQKELALDVALTALRLVEALEKDA